MIDFDALEAAFDEAGADTAALEAIMKRVQAEIEALQPDEQIAATHRLSEIILKRGLDARAKLP